MRLVALLLVFLAQALAQDACASTAGAKRPNIILVLSDDQDAVLGGDQYMRVLKNQLGKGGVQFSDYILNFALCCPSRASILTGQCVHNTGIASLVWPLGGAKKFRLRGLEPKTAPYLLQQAGYRTGLIGKYLNGYGTEDPPAYVPPGYDTWFGQYKGLYVNWYVSDQGVSRFYGTSPEEYATDVLTRRSVEFIDKAAEDPRPFWLYVAPAAPHTPCIPAQRHQGKMAGLQVPRSPNWNESDANLLTSVAKSLNNLTRNIPISAEEAAALDLEYQLRAETLLSVDDQIAAIIRALERVGQLDNTYIFYSSDNGYKLGNHRKVGKLTPYEEDVRVPLYVRGPGVPQGLVLPHLVTNTDLTPTWLELAGVADPYAAERDGKSFVKVLRKPTARWRKAVNDFRTGVHMEMILGAAKAGASVVSTLVPDVAGGAPDVFAGMRPQQLPPQLVARCENEDWSNPSSELYALCSGIYGTEDADNMEWRDMGSFEDWQQYVGLATKQGIAAINPRALVQAKKKNRTGKEHPPLYYRPLWFDPYYALRIQSTVGRYKFIQYSTGYELYDLNKDPYELNNYYMTAPKPLVDYLTEALEQLKTCKGANCTHANIQGLAAAIKAGG